ncbi:MarR family winged helix-turn-helix transcriptional regulator [Plantibacter sp. Mn2098]|uniref:MarR family winged helix-turn-helix transcriptional regulator n=1 Tax=Plantibacter sp. Mn2098 TaxID=3395266 RepID=UPI003BCEA961
MERTIDPTMLLAAQRLRLNTDRLRRIVRKAGVFEGLSRSQESVLSLLDRQGPLSTADLARREPLRPQSMGTIVADLIAKEFVEKRPDPNDGRRVLVTLTDAGRTIIAEVSRTRDSDLAALLTASLTPDEQSTLTTAIGLLERLTIDTDAR